jgi:tripartite-type tricarboxylate transporter receptor subunit TctC
MAHSTSAVAAAPGLLSAVSLYHKLGQRAAAIVSGVADPNFKARLLALGVEANPLTSRAFGQFIADEIAKWAKVIKFANISR